MSNKLKILIIQLPHQSYLDRNVPMAAGYLKASAYKYGLLEKVDIEILDPIISDHSGCQRLIDEIIYRGPDILGFSMYLWNAQRTLYVIGKIKAILPHIKVVVGGPEVTKTSDYILFDPNIDIFTIGEGEITFVDILNYFLDGTPRIDEIPGIGYLKDNEIVFNKPREKMKDLELIPSPYLLGYINPEKYREMVLFTMRGCMLGCSYCSWATRGKLRAYSIDRLRNELLLAKKIGEQRGENIIINMYDSALNASPVFFEFCKVIKEINKDKSLKFSAFLLANLIDEKVAKLLRECNFTNIEVGLQSANSDILANINRYMDKNQFLHGIRCIEKEGIPITIDIILGLPGDSPTSFENTLKFLSENGLDNYLRYSISMFNLSLAQGTRLSHEIDKFGAKVQPYPPFYVLSTDSFPCDELKIAMGRYKIFSADLDRLRNLHYPSLISNSIQDYSHDIASLEVLDYPIRNIILDVGTSFERTTRINLLAEFISKNVASRLTILIQGNIEHIADSREQIRTLITQISDKNPYITWDIFLEPKGNGIPHALIEEIASFMKRPATFLDHRDEIFPSDMQDIRRRSINIFSILPFEKDKGISVKSVDCIGTEKIDDIKNSSLQESNIHRPKGNGFLINYQAGLDIESIKRSMTSLYENNELTKKRGIFFKDWVMQRLWEQEFIKLTPERLSPYYELMINSDLNISKKLFDENQLHWDAITKWKLLRDQYYGSNIEEIVLTKINEVLQLKNYI